MARTLGIIAPSLPSVGDRKPKIERAIAELERTGNEVIVAPSVFSQSAYKSASARERAAQLSEFMANPQIDAVLCTTGGYNSIEMLPYLNWDQLRAARAALVGYSDVTALLLAMIGRTSAPLIQGAMLVDWVSYSNAFVDLWSVLDGVRGEMPLPSQFWESEHGERFQAPQFAALNLDSREAQYKAEGPLVAGNLSTFNLLLGTPYFPNLEGKILMLEYDKEESFCLPSIERMLWQLRLSGSLDRVAAFVFGALQPVVVAEELREGRSIVTILKEATEGLNVPIFFNAPFGHMYPSWQVRQGSWVRVSERGVFVEAPPDSPPL
jgi:muramoyltetrapeptide carboxypeptidase